MKARKRKQVSKHDARPRSCTDRDTFKHANTHRPYKQIEKLIEDHFAILIVGMLLRKQVAVACDPATDSEIFKMKQSEKVIEKQVYFCSLKLIHVL